MKFKTKAALKLAKMARIDLASQALDEITLYFLDGDELVEGIEVFEMDDNGEYIVPANGSYKWGDKTVVITDGVVESINSSESSEEMEIDEPIKDEIEDKVKELESVASDLIDVVKNLGGDIEVIKEDLKKDIKLRDERIKKLELSLEEATKKSNKEFVKPNPGKDKKESGFDADKELEKFGIK